MRTKTNLDVVTNTVSATHLEEDAVVNNGEVCVEELSAEHSVSSQAFCDRILDSSTKLQQEQQDSTTCAIVLMVL